MTVNERMAIEQHIVAYLLRAAEERGWQVIEVFDSEETVKLRSEDAASHAMDVVFSVYDSVIKFRKELGNGCAVRHNAVIVLGNDGGDVIADCSVASSHPGDDWDDLMAEVDEVAAKFEPA